MQVFSALQLGALSLFSQFQIHFVSQSPFDCDTEEAKKEEKRERYWVLLPQQICVKEF